MEVESECAQQLCGLLVVDHDDGLGHRHLDDEELILLVAAVEFAYARCLLLPLLEIPGRIDLSSLNDAECKLKFRFTRRQICWVHEALQVVTELAFNHLHDDPTPGEPGTTTANSEELRVAGIILTLNKKDSSKGQEELRAVSSNNKSKTH